MKSSEKIKVLHISQASGGVKTYIENIIYHLDKSKFEPFLVSPDKQFIAEAEEKGVKCEFVDLKRSPSIQDFQALIKLNRIIKKHHIDVIHAHSAKGGALGRLVGNLSGCKVIFTPNAFSYLSFKGIRRTLYIRIEKFLKSFTHLLLAVSDSEKDRALNEIGFRETKVESIPNFIIPMGKKKDDYGLKKKVGMIGRITHQKRPEHFVQLAAHLVKKGHNVDFELLGVGLHDHLLEETKALIKEHQLEDSISLSNWGSYMQVIDFYETLDVFVLTSLFEGLPFSLLEAMDYGLPCLVSNVDGNKDAVKHGENGYVYGDTSDLFLLCEKLLTNEDDRERIGKNAIENIKNNHNTRIAIKEVEGIYDQLTSGN